MAKTTFWSLGYDSYQGYLRSAHWQELRTRYFASKRKRHHKCGRCGATDRKLELHHKTYKRIGNERLQDLVPLCRPCHQQAHDWEHQGAKLWTAHKRASAGLPEGSRQPVT